MFTGVDILVILVALFFILYLARPENSEFKLDIDPAALIMILVAIAIVVAAL